ncbi:RHS repeat-associated core domain-containing protein [Catellatospora sp. NEAU-YM18]|uniref:RHS repeat-associated core domain-containing protein n=1 Tax=Catellatospora tritici TaxID=2851566 RepID=UPI001C2D9458|nr:RHS repeat-associated core domain-containing protein [Catellatospora tritici]
MSGDPTTQQRPIATAMYTAYGELSKTIYMPPGGGPYVDNLFDYYSDTHRLKTDSVKPQNAADTISNRTYTYDHSGNITTVTDAPGVGSTDTQCFRYDTLARLTTAWTPTSGVPCSTDPAVANLGGPAKYWQGWTFDSTSSLKTETSHTSGGNTTRSYTVPVGGQNVVRPHAVTQMSVADVTTNYTYDNTGNTVCRPTGTAANNCSTGNNSQTLTWDAEGRLSAVSAGGSTTETNIYDANGVRLIRRDSTGTTLYLPGQEIRREGGINTGTRYYSFAGRICASRKGTSNISDLTWLYGDHQGTQQISVNAGTQTVSIRRQTPYGAPRGTNPSWANNKGFVGGDNDPTGLVNIGARQYDPNLGRFISTDPLMDLQDPQSFNPYSYSKNSPVTFSDPSGLKFEDETGAAYGKRLAAASHSEKSPAKPPRVENPRLQKIIDEVYSVYVKSNGRATGYVGDGTAIDALLEELQTGLKTARNADGSGGNFHYKDVLDLAGELSGLLEGDFRASMKLEDGRSMRQFEYDSLLSSADQTIARSLFARMWRALRTKDTAGAISAEIENNSVISKQVEGALENIKNRFSVSDVTGENFNIGGGGHPQRVVSRGPAELVPEGRLGGTRSGGMGRVGGAMSILDFGAGAYFMLRYGPQNFNCIMSGIQCVDTTPTTL